MSERCARTAEEGTTVTAAELGPEHHGWYIDIPDPTLVTGRRAVTVCGVRKWAYDGQLRVGILDRTDTGPYYGVEHHVPGNAVCTVRRVFKRGVPKARAKDYRSAETESGGAS